jgi:hypothetical protein
MTDQAFSAILGLSSVSGKIPANAERPDEQVPGEKAIITPPTRNNTAASNQRVVTDIE